MIKNESNPPNFPITLECLIALETPEILKLLNSSKSTELLEMLECLAILDAIENTENADLSQIARDLLETDFHLEMLELIESRNLLNADQLSDLAQMMEICPMHSCDINICIDDEIAECAEFH